VPLKLPCELKGILSSRMNQKHFCFLGPNNGCGSLLPGVFCIRAGWALQGLFGIAYLPEYVHPTVAKFIPGMALGAAPSGCGHRAQILRRVHEPLHRFWTGFAYGSGIHAAEAAWQDGKNAGFRDGLRAPSSTYRPHYLD
jgi:hypothetical protein